MFGRPFTRRSVVVWGALGLAVVAGGTTLGAITAHPSERSTTTATGSPLRTVPATTAGGAVPPTTAGTPPSTGRPVVTTAGAPATTARPTATTSRTCTPVVDRWTTARTAEQVLMVSGEFADLAASRSDAAAGVGGFVLFGSPPAGSGPAIAAGISALDAAASAAAAPAPWVSTDEEGGSIQRLAAVVGSLEAPRTMAAQMSPSGVTAAVQGMAVRMRALGVGVDLAPVLDVAAAGDPVADEGERSFSSDASVAATYGVAYAAGLRAGGVVAVAKHFPGLGGATADTDLAPATVPSLAQDPQALAPFKAAIAAGIPVVMVGHPVVPGLSGGLPASLSAATYQLLASLGFRGLSITDDLDARAVSAAGYPQPAAAVAAVRAGADMVMLDASQGQQAAAALVGAVHAGTLSLARLRDAATAVLQAKGLPTCS